jgi:type IV secretion system protein VirB8
MNDQPDKPERVSIAVQALSKQGQGAAKEVWRFQRAMMRMSRAVNTSMRWGFWAAWAIAIAEACAIVYLAPLVRVVPVFIPVSSDNTLAMHTQPMQIEPSVTLASLNKSQEAIASVLWQYVRLRESYSWAEANYAWDVVSAMSSVDVRTQFQNWYVYTNKSSPQATYQFKGVIKVSWSAANLKDDKFSANFWRQRYDDGQPVSKPELWTCDLVWSTDYSTPRSDRLQFNPGGIVVTSYPGCYPAGMRPGGISPNVPGQ